MTTLAERLSMAMAHAGFNQKVLEERAGLTRGYLSRVLKGDRSRVDAGRISKLAEACGVDLRWLSTGEGEMLGQKSEETVETVEKTEREDVDAGDNAFERAMAEAFRQGKFELVDLDAVRRVLRQGATMLRDEAELVSAARQWLRAAAGLRRAGRQVTVETLVYRMARPSRRVVDDGETELRGLGGEKPAKPVGVTKRK